MLSRYRTVSFNTSFIIEYGNGKTSSLFYGSLAASSTRESVFDILALVELISYILSYKNMIIIFVCT